MILKRTNRLTTKVQHNPLNLLPPKRTRNPHSPHPPLDLLSQQTHLPFCDLFDLLPEILAIDRIPSSLCCQDLHVRRRYAEVVANHLEALKTDEDFIDDVLRDRAFLMGVGIILGVVE